MKFKGIGSASFDSIVAIGISFVIFSSVAIFAYNIYENNKTKNTEKKYIEILTNIHRAMSDYYSLNQGNFPNDIKSFKSLFNAGLLDKKTYAYSVTENLYEGHLPYDTITVDNKYKVILYNDCKQLCPQWNYTFSYLIDKKIITQNLCRELIKNFSMQLPSINNIRYDVLVDFRQNSPYTNIDPTKDEEYHTQICSNIRETQNDRNFLIRFLNVL